MNKDIKKKIEEYVMDEFDNLAALDSSVDGYYSDRSSIVKEINTFVELLQKDDINETSRIFNESKLKNEITKIDKEHEINLEKIKCEISKNKDNLDFEKEKIKKSYEIDNKKIENDIDKTQIDKEINKEKLKIEIKKNEDNLHLENRKIDINETKNNSDADLKKKELNMNAGKDIELRNDRLVKVLIDGAAIIVPIIFYNVWMKKGFEFEETGTFTSNTFKNLISKFKPGK